MVVAQNLIVMIYSNHYENSWALLIGINSYENAPPLGYAANDAEAVRDSLIHRWVLPRYHGRLS